MSQSPSLPPPGQPVIRVKGVTHLFKKVVKDEHGKSSEIVQTALENIDLEVMPGELVILKGPSGCGKTTLLTLVGGLRKLQEGEIEIWDGRQGCYTSLLKMKEADLVELRRSIGFIFQRHNL